MINNVVTEVLCMCSNNQVNGSVLIFMAKGPFALDDNDIIILVVKSECSLW